MQVRSIVRGVFSTNCFMWFAALVLSLIVQSNAEAVVVSSQPANTVLTEGQSVTFRVSATSSDGSAVYYTWYKDGVRLSTTTNSLSLASVVTSAEGTYGCTVRDAVSTYVCRSFTLTVNVVPVDITVQPVSQSVQSGSNVTFTVGATGSRLRYQWYGNGVAIVGATTNTLTLASVAADDAGDYYVNVRNSETFERSERATLAVTSFQRVSITQQPVGQSVLEGSAASFSVAATGTPTLQYQWYFNGNAISGATASTYRLSHAALANAGTYYAVVRNSGSTATSGAVALAVTPFQAVSITQQPVSATVLQGSAATLSVGATGSGTLTYQWYFNGAAISGATARSYAISSAALTNAGNYYVVVRNSTSSVTSSTVALAVTAFQRVAITSQPANQVVNTGTAVRMAVGATGTGPLTYQWYRNGSAISGATSSAYSITSASSTTAGSYYAVVRNSGSSATSTTATLSVLASSTTYSASLGWARPTLREDGTPLDAADIAGFNLYYSTSSTGTMTRIASLTASQLRYVVANLAAGTHYFALSTVDSAGLESSLSGRARVAF